MNIRALLLVVVAGCGHSAAPKPVTGRSEASNPATAPLDALLADLEAMRPFIVVHPGRREADCATYPAAASPVVAKIAAETPAANDTRTKAAPDAVAQWQAAHDAALAKLIADVALPLRAAFDCPATVKDDAWTKVSMAIVAVAQPSKVPDAVIKRRAMYQEALNAGANVKTPEDCKKLDDEMSAKEADIKKQIEAMSQVDQFVDDKVWEEEDEQKMKTDPRVQTIQAVCK